MLVLALSNDILIGLGGAAAKGGKGDRFVFE